MYTQNIVLNFLIKKPTDSATSVELSTFQCKNRNNVTGTAHPLQVRDSVKGGVTRNLLKRSSCPDELRDTNITPTQFTDTGMFFFCF